MNAERIPDKDPSTDAGAARRVSWLGRHIPLVSGISALLLAVLLGALLVVRSQEILLGLDEEWAEEMVEIRGPLGNTLALFFNYAGGTLIGALVIPLAPVIVLPLLRRRWAALYFAMASAVS